MNESNLILRYEVAYDDLIAAAGTVTKDAARKRRENIYRLTVTSLYVLGIYLFNQGLTFDLMALLNIIAPVGIVYFLLLPLHTQIGTRLARWIGGDKKYDYILGSQEVEIAEDGLIWRNRYMEVKYTWRVIRCIRPGALRIVIETKSDSAVTIPMQRITDGDYRAFMFELGRRFQPDDSVPQKTVQP